MFRSLVVPLDGSPTAAQALPYVPFVAMPDACITLVGVATPVLDMPCTSAQETGAIEQMERTRAFLWQDLETRAQSLRAQGFRVVTTVRTGDVIEEILTCAQETDADLIALTTHGASGLSRWMLGSVARRLLHIATLPTLVIHSATEHASGAPQIDGVIVPLDGSRLAERSLDIADDLAARCNVPLRLIRVVPNQTARYQKASPSDIVVVRGLSIALKQAHTAAADYIRSTVDRLRSTGRDATGDVRVGDPAATLSALLAQEPTALVVIATHGVNGGDWWTFGSVAEKIVTTAPNPTLIVRPVAGKTGRMRHDPALAARYPD